MFTRDFVCSQASSYGYFVGCLFLFDACRPRRLPEWMHLPSTVLKKRTCFGIPLIQKFMVFQKKKRTTSLCNDFTITTYYNSEFLQFFNRFHTFGFCQGTANAPCPNLRWFYLRRRKRRNYSQRGSTVFAAHRWGPVLEALGAAGRFWKGNWILQRQMEYILSQQKNYTCCYTSTLFNAFLGIFTCVIMLN